MQTQPNYTKIRSPIFRLHIGIKTDQNSDCSNRLKKKCDFQRLCSLSRLPVCVPCSSSLPHFNSNSAPSSRGLLLLFPLFSISFLSLFLSAQRLPHVAMCSILNIQVITQLLQLGPYSYLNQSRPISLNQFPKWR